MIVCICNNISEANIEAFLKDGLTQDEIVDVITSTVCGCCRQYVIDIIKYYQKNP